MNPTLCFVLIDREPGYPGLADFLPKLRDALDESLNQHLAPLFGGSYVVRVAAGPEDRGANEVAVNIRQSSRTDPQGALGWHTTTNGVPDIELPLDTMTGLTGDGEALDAVADHELKETVVDPGANRLVDNERGVVSAMEACDRVQGTTYKATNGLNLSDFLTPAAWVPGAQGRYDYCGVLKSQDDAQGKPTLGPGGYDAEGATPDLSDVMGARVRRAGSPLILRMSGLMYPGRALRLSMKLHRLRRRSAILPNMPHLQGAGAVFAEAPLPPQGLGDCPGCGATLTAEDVAYDAGLREGKRHVAGKLGAFLGAGYGAIAGRDAATNGPMTRAVSALLDSPIIAKLGRDLLAGLGVPVPDARPTHDVVKAPTVAARCGATHENAEPPRGPAPACPDCARASSPTDQWWMVDGLAHAFTPLRAT